MVEKQKVLLKRSSVPGKMPSEITGSTVDLGELFINIASGDADNFLTTLRAEGSSAVTNDYIKWSDDVANERKFATKEEVMDNELVVSTIITKINESVGLDENSESVLPNGESLSDAIIELQSRTSIIEESDPIFTKSVAASITSGDTSNWNNKLGKTEKAVSAKTSDSAITSVSATTAKSATTSVSATTAKSASTVSFSGIPTGKTSTTVARGDHSHTPDELGLESALKYHGVTTTKLKDGDTTKPITIGGVNHYQSAGCVVIYSTTASGDTEFVWNGSSWEKLGDGVNYKVKQTAVSSPSANGNATSFIDTISQDTNGVITVTKKNITTASASNLGLMKVGNFLTSTGGTVSVSTGTSNTTVARGDHAHANYALASDLNSLIEDVEDNEYVIATALNLINASAGFNEDGTSTLPNGESLSEAIIELQSRTSVIEESDPIFTKSPASSITTANITSWNNKLGKTEKAVSAKTSDSAITSLSATTSVSATTASKATSDGNGNNISETYALKTDVENVIKEIEDNELVVSTIITKINESVGLDENSDSVLPNGESLSEAIIALQNNSSGNDYISVTHSELKDLISNNGLKIGAFYRITDYTYVVRSGYESQFNAAGNYFDIIVKAVSENRLSEDAQACRNANDNGYFANTNFAAWELKYCIDNDQNRFGWAATNGKGVVYHLKDEFGNEAGYDFKNIKFFRNYVDLSTTGNISNNRVIFENASLIDLAIYDANYDGLSFPTALRYASYSTKRTGNEFRAMGYDSGKKLDGNSVYGLYELKGFFPTNVFVKTTGADSGYFYTFSYIPNIKNNFSECYDATVYSGAASFTPRNNVIKPSYHKTANNSSVYKLRMIFDNVFIMNGSVSPWHCYDNVIEEGCVGVTIDSGCYNNIIKTDSSHVVVGEHSNYNTFGENSYNIVLGKRNTYNTIDKNCSYIYIWDDSKGNKVGNNCQHCFVLKNATNNIWEEGCKDSGIRANYSAYNVFKPGSRVLLIDDGGDSTSAKTINHYIVNLSAESGYFQRTVFPVTTFDVKYILASPAGVLDDINVGDTLVMKSNTRQYIVGAPSTADTFQMLHHNEAVYMEGGNLFSSSDKTLKTHIENVDGDLDKIKRIPKVIFHWNNDEEKKRQLGTYAQDVEEFYPEVVTKDENEIRGVAYDRMGVIALAGIDKLYELVQQLQTKNEELEKRIKDLEK